jgi:protease I
MATDSLHGLKVAILVEDGFEQVELQKPKKSPRRRRRQDERRVAEEGQGPGMGDDRMGRYDQGRYPLDNARPDDFDALLLPGGVMNPDKLRLQPKAAAFVRATAPGRSSKPAPPKAARLPPGLPSKPT